MATTEQKFLWWQQEVIYQIYPRSFQDSSEKKIGFTLPDTRTVWHKIICSAEHTNEARGRMPARVDAHESIDVLPLTVSVYATTA